ncbi:YbaB/EbfC family nucleoid-associated protein [Microbacterium sp. NPDC090007]|uniref:YbaB/EbfC family nucleoid-associated protein n=1 Tax=Microbacterium sp. NPDC090007 TaxID=3364204 RepID=UPI00381B7C25
MTDELEARLDAIRSRLDTQIEAARAARDAVAADAEELRSVESTSRSANGECEVTADADGVVLRVQLASRLSDIRALENLLVETIAKAQRSARDAASQKAARLLGDTSFPGAHLRAAHRTGA